MPHNTQYLRKKPRSKRHLNKPSKQCEICDEKLNSILYMLQARGCTNCGKSGCKNCVKYSRTFDNGQDASVCKNCKDLPKKMKNISFVKKPSEAKVPEENDRIIEEMDEDDVKMDEARDIEGVEQFQEIPPQKNVEFLQEDTVDDLNEGILPNKQAEEEKLQLATARHNEKLALSRFKEISAENNKLKGELKRASLSRADSFTSSPSVLLTRLDEIQMISEGRDEELIKVGKQMDDLVHKLQITEAQKHKALDDLQMVQTNQIEQLEQIVGRLSTQKNRTLEIKQKLQNAVDERDYHKKIAKLKEEEIDNLMAENDKLREILEDTDTSSTSTFASDEIPQKSTTGTQAAVSEVLPVKLIVDFNDKSPPSRHMEVQTDHFPEELNGAEEEWEVERRKMQDAMDSLRNIVKKWKDDGVMEQEIVV